MNRIIPTVAALGVAISLLTACSPADDSCDNAAGTHPVAVAQVAPERPSGGTSGGRGSGSRSSGSKPKPSKPKPGTQHSTTGGSHSHHHYDDYDDCDND
ncbi:hypothetical protein [Streptomyces sp. OR43]|uniref:hypothetical protein n=1 Tax=Streptomyces sp. or43 TaxID=2478957 RepID=UPI0011CD6724|nr:hypothetical protein [Streptomyces sp. or43]TXS36950.1 hypothetical protein EAO72_26560 [Streptomyces sp. or43]